MPLEITKSIKKINVISREAFEQTYYYPQKPVVIKGLFENQAAGQKWDLEYFKNTMGDVEVGIFDASLERIDRSYKKPHYTLSFRDYLEEIEKGPTKKRLFLFNAIKFNKALLNDFEFPTICGGFIKSLPFMFFGGDQSVTRIHQDMDMSCVFLSQFTGKKRVVLFDPKYSELLYRFPFNVHTGVNIMDPDYEKYPGLEYVKGEEVTLEYGETLFMPSGWWHHIEYQGSGFSMSMRCLSPKKRDWIKGGWNVAVNTNVDEIMLKILGDHWFNYKTKLAQKCATNLLKEISTKDTRSKKSLPA